MVSGQEMAISKDSIIAEIQRTAVENCGLPLGQESFERDTGISTGTWRGKYWRTWSEALSESGFAPNRPNEAYEQSFLVLSLVELTRKYGRFPTSAEVIP
ncbi:MAG: hypothetical protein ACLQIQ_08860 [Beijerinckiaceae bacterium]